jgi:hypothetical protein
MTNPSQDLRAAADAVERAISRLDTTEHPCPVCGCRVLANLPEGRIAEQFGPLPERLRNAANRLDNAAKSRHEETV